MKINWQDVTETTQFLELTGERIPVTVEGMRYLAKKFEALQMDYNYLVEEIIELEFTTRFHNQDEKPTLFMDPY